MHKDKLLDSAQKFLARGQLAKAIGEYQKLVDAFPRDYRHLQKLAELLCREQRYSEALPCLERVAENFTATGFYLKAIAIYKQIQKIDPTRLATSQQIAELYERQGLTGTALSEYRQQFLACERNGQAKEAQTLLLKMIHLDPGNTALRCRLIETLLALDDEPGATVAFQDLVSLLGGMAAIVTAFFPTNCKVCTVDLSARIHMIGAVVLFATVVYFCLIAFPRSVNDSAGARCDRLHSERRQPSLSVFDVEQRFSRQYLSIDMEKD